MLSRLLVQRWPVTATLSDPAVTQRGKHYLDLKPEHWNMIEELSQVLEPFEAATVFLSGQQYITLSVLPQLVHKLKNQILRLHQWGQSRLMQQNKHHPACCCSGSQVSKTEVLACWPSIQGPKHSTKYGTCCCCQKSKQGSLLKVKMETSSTAQDSPKAHAKRVTSFFDILGSDSSNNDEEVDEEQQLN